LNYLPLLELFLIALPLLFHAGYGVLIAKQARPELRRYPYRPQLALLAPAVLGAWGSSPSC
jgi:hypothetical protein